MLSASGLLANGNAATILANGNAYALPAPKVIQFKVSYYHIHDEKWWDIKKISAYLDNGVSTGESQSGMLNNSDRLKLENRRTKRLTKQGYFFLPIVGHICQMTFYNLELNEDLVRVG